MEKAQAHAILVVDDEASVLQMLKALLTRSGHRVYTASNGSEALKVLANEPVEIILSDNMMPGMSGTELLAQAEAVRPDAIRLLMTAEPDTESLAAAINRGHVFRYIQKPFTPASLKEAMEAAARQCELLSENRRLQELTEEQNRALWEATFELEKKVQERTGEIVSQKQMIEESHNHLIELTAQRSDMLLILAHELNTPLAVIKGFVQLLNEHNRDWTAEKRAQILSVVGESLERLDRNVGGILQALDAGKEEFALRIAPFDLREVAKNSARDAQPLLERRRHHFTLNLSRQELPVRAEQDLIRNALDNLLLNAIRFTPDGGTVSIKSEQKDGFALLHVSDSGVGIPKELQEKVFERFFEGKSAMHHSSGDVEFGSGSLGLGLALTKSIMDRHGGSVLLTSAPGKGSTFTLRLPLEPT